MLVESGATRGAGRPGAWPWPRSAPRTCRSSTRVRALGVQHPTLDEGLEALAAVIAAGMEQRARRRWSPTCRSRAASTTTPAPSTRPSSSAHESWGSFCSGGRYDSLASDGQDDLPRGRHLDRRLPAARPAARSRSAGSPPAGRPRRACSSPSTTRRAAPPRPRVAAALRARGIPCEVAPSAAKFGKQIRYAERRGIPYVWFPGAPARRRQAGPTRSRTSARASRSTPTPRSWTPPSEDLHPQVLPDGRPMDTTGTSPRPRPRAPTHPSPRQRRAAAHHLPARRPARRRGAPASSTGSPRPASRSGRCCRSPCPTSTARPTSRRPRSPPPPALLEHPTRRSAARSWTRSRPGRRTGSRSWDELRRTRRPGALRPRVVGPARLRP